MRLLLIRHGETPSNIAAVLDTAVPGPGLTDLGHAQAQALADRLGSGTFDIGALFVSVQERARQTAAPLADTLGLEPRVRTELREIEAGVYEMLGDVDAHRGYHGLVFGWADGDLDPRMPGGEDGHEVLARFGSVVAEAAALDLETVAIVAHGAIIRTWVGAQALNTEPGFAAENILPNTGVVVLTGDLTTGWTAIRWADQPLY